MEIVDLKPAPKTITTGDQMHQLISDLFPICRSITGNGVGQTLQMLKEEIPLQIFKIPTGTKVFDWRVPMEWNIRDAYIKNSKGEKIVDFNQSNLHVLNYSIPVHLMVSLQELKNHLYTMPEYPDWIPYRTSYYKEDWGFCMAHNKFMELKNDMYEVVIDSTLEPGHLTYGEYYKRGESSDEILVSTHICHPSLANDNLSGISVSTFLAKYVSGIKTRYSYRFLFIPGTIGAITWLSINELKLNKIKHGLITSLLGDAGNFTYKRSRMGKAEIDEIVDYIFKVKHVKSRVIDFVPYGYDERQFCSPGFNLPVGCLTRTTFGEYPEYHTSGDNLDFVKPDALEQSLKMCIEIFEMVEQNRIYVNQNPKCEPQLGRRGLYNSIGGENNSKEFQLALLWVLNLSDGE